MKELNEDPLGPVLELAPDLAEALHRLQHLLQSPG
jgi:hypothetical protein